MSILDIDDDKLRRNVVLCSILILLSAGLDITFPIRFDNTPIRTANSIGASTFWGIALLALVYMAWHYWTSDATVQMRENLIAELHDRVSSIGMNFVRNTAKLACEHSLSKHHPGEELMYQPYVQFRDIVDSALKDGHAHEAMLDISLANVEPHWPPWTARYEVVVVRTNWDTGTNRTIPLTREYRTPDNEQKCALARAMLGLCLGRIGVRLLTPTLLTAAAFAVALYQFIVALV